MNTKQQLLEQGLTPCPNPLRSMRIGHLMVGYQRAADFWLFRGKNGIERPRFSVTQVTSDNDVWWRVIVGKSMLLFTWLETEAKKAKQ
jgi:hypothetical protein